MSINDPHRAVALSKTQDPKGFAEKVTLLSATPSFVSFLSNYYSDVRSQIERMAAISTVEQAASLQKNSAGMRYVVSQTADGDAVVNLVPSESGDDLMQPRLALHCWQAYVAFLAWQVGAGITCAAVTFAGVIPGLICGGIKITADMLIDWNKAC